MHDAQKNTLLGSAAQDKINAQYNQLISIFDGIDEIIYITDPDTYEILYANQALRKTFGDVIGRKCYAALQKSDAPCPFCINKYIFGENLGKTHIWELQSRVSLRWYHCISRAILWPDGRMVNCTIAIDITAPKQAEEKLRDSEERYRAIFEQAADSILIIDPQSGDLLEFNDRAHNNLGYTRDEFRKLKIPDFEIIESAQEVQEHLRRIAETGADTFETKQRTKNGQVIDVLVSARSISIQGRKIIQTIWRDITERKSVEKEREKLNKELTKSNKRLKQLVLLDPHTGLYNHRYLPEVIEREFSRAKRYGHTLSVIMLDLDYFKSINDVYGHVFGDLVLKQLAAQLKKLVRRYDIVIRYGGEEFIVISPGTDKASALFLAQRLLEAISLYNFGNTKHTVKLKLSLAVTSYPEDNITKGMDLVKLTEQILNKAKESGGNRVYSSLDISKEKVSPSGVTKENPEVKFLKDRIEKLNKKTNQSLIESIFAFARTIELKDHCTGEHVEKTVRYATEIARVLGLSKNDVEMVRRAAILHDLGKIGISEKILDKRAKLTKKEFKEIKKHPRIGIEIIRPIQFLQPVIPLILYHHERWDGKGYPHGLKGEEIPIGARIVAIADVYEALISERPYHKAYPESKAIEIIKNGSGTQFDPHIVGVFLSILKR